MYLRVRLVIHHKSTLAPGGPTTTNQNSFAHQTTLFPFAPNMAEHSAGRDFLLRPRGDEELQHNPESSPRKPQEEYDPQGSTSHSAFTNESEHSHSAFTNEPEPTHSAFTDESEYTQSHDHDDDMVYPEGAADKPKERYVSRTAAGRRDDALRCQECLKPHPPPCNAPQEDKDLLKRDPEGYKRYLNSQRRK